MTTDLTREELLAHLGYVRDDVRELKTDVASVSRDTQANTLAIAALQQQLAAADAAHARRRTTADALVVAVLGTVGAGLIEWAKSKLAGGVK